MISKLHKRATTAGMTKDELWELLDSGVGVFIVDKAESETRFVFAAYKGSYRIKYIGSSEPQHYAKEVKKLLSRSHDVRYLGSTISSYYKYLCEPTMNHEISIVDKENKPINIGSTLLEALKDFK